MLRDAETLPAHRPAEKEGSSDNITTLNDGRGTSKSYTLSRLSREKPKLYERW